MILTAYPSYSNPASHARRKRSQMPEENAAFSAAHSCFGFVQVSQAFCDTCSATRADRKRELLRRGFSDRRYFSETGESLTARPKRQFCGAGATMDVTFLPLAPRGV